MFSFFSILNELKKTKEITSKTAITEDKNIMLSNRKIGLKLIKKRSAIINDN